MITKDQISQEITRVQSDYFAMNTGQKFPFDIELLIESYGIDIVPTANLERDFAVDAVLSADFTTIYCDLERYMDRKYDTRMRFSLAHELAHIRLHKNHFYAQFENVEITSSSIHDHHYGIDDSKRKQLEYEAHSFAGQLLVPTVRLRAEAAQLILNNIDMLYESNLGVNRILAGMINKIANAFGVSTDVIEKRITNEKIAEYLELDVNSPLNQVQKPELLTRLSKFSNINFVHYN